MSVPAAPSFPTVTPHPGQAGRPLLRKGLGYLMVHFTGVGVRFNDPARDEAYALEVCRYKQWEYNYLVGLGGSVYAQAGAWKAGHCLNFNESSIGVLMMNAIGVKPTAAQIDAFHQLRVGLVASGQLAADHQVVPHYGFRDTSCPGVMLADLPGRAKVNSPTGQGREGQVIAALRRSLTAPTPTPPPDDGDDMKLTILAPRGCYARFVAWTNSQGVALSCRWLRDNADRDQFVRLGAVERACEVADLRPLALLGPVPTGDPGHMWSAGDFAAVAG